MAIFQNEDNPHGESMKLFVMPEAIGDSPRLAKARGAMFDVCPHIFHQVSPKHFCPMSNEQIRTRSVCSVDQALESTVFDMPTPFEFRSIADLIKLAASTAEECSQYTTHSQIDRIREVCLRIKADAEELRAISGELEQRRFGRSD